ncbi:protein TolR [Polycyclovorans algicola]|uniref:protein TolR n=1 Tax=Polycyclovorans algicola TaxID=616992 RepID=UPI0004A730AC|nr:protein TolR [Polycyclovorans algicola]
MARRKLSSEINVVPYIDVMLVLLVIFMITAPLMTQGIEVDLPQTEAQTISTDDEPTIVSVDDRGQYFLNRGERPDEPMDLTLLAEQVNILVEANPDQLILLEGDGAAQYAAVAQAMSTLQGIGVKKLGFITKPTESVRTGR